MLENFFTGLDQGAARAEELSDRIGHLLIAQALRGNRAATHRFAQDFLLKQGKEFGSIVMAHIATALTKTARGAIAALSDASPEEELVGVSAVSVSDNPDEALAFRMVLCAVQGDYDSVHALMSQRQGSTAEFIAYQIGALAEVNALFAKRLYDLNPDNIEPAWGPLLQQYQLLEVSPEAQEDLRRKMRPVEVDE